MPYKNKQIYKYSNQRKKIKQISEQINRRINDINMNKYINKQTF